MSTRRVEAGTRRRQNGWASAPEYDVLRGLNGTAVAFKAALQEDPKAREILFFLQALSLREGGVKRIARELLEMFPERIGTPTMHRVNCALDKKLKPEDCRAIYMELFPEEFVFPKVGSRSDEFFVADFVADCTADILARLNDDGSEKERQPEPPFYLKNSEWFLASCHDRASALLPQFIEELCCDPKMEVAGEADARRRYSAAVEIVLEDARDNLESNPRLARERPDLQTTLQKDNHFRCAVFPYFHDALGALFEYQRRHVERTRAVFVETSVSKIVFEAFDYVLETGRSALIEGHSGYGKTTALKACYEMNLGRARYVQLSGITSRTAFLRRIADACGVASGGGMSSDRIQARVEAFLKRTKLALLIDESQYLFPQGRRITSHPELLNWLNTSVYNEGVPFLLSATRQFTLRRQAVEQQTDWSSEQSRRRIRKVFPLPDVPTTQDLQAVARKLLGGMENAAEFVVGYAQASRGYFQTITDAIEDAQLIARRAGRDRITAKDLQAAVKEWRAPSDAALQRVFDSKPEKPRRGSRIAAAPVENDDPEDRFNEPAFARRETQPVAVPALTG